MRPTHRKSKRTCEIIKKEEERVRKGFKISLILVITVLVFTASAVVWAFVPKTNLKPSEYNVGTTYELAMKGQKPIVALFYADWCTYCKRFMPKYKILSEVYKNKYNFVMINVENPTYEKLVKDYAISGFPTIYIIDPTIDNRVLLNNALYDDLFKLRVELERYSRIRAMINK